MSNIPLYTPWTLNFERDGSEDLVVIRDANNWNIATSRQFWLPQGDDPMPPILASMRLMHAAPKLLEALQAAEKFICGFKGDEMQEGMDQLLTSIRETLAEARADAGELIPPAMSPDRSRGRPAETSVGSKHRILITVEGSVIQDIGNIPHNTVIEVREFDKDGDRSHPTWCEEHQAFVGVWVGPELSLAAPYRYCRGRDGTDETFDIYRDGDGRPMVSVGYWDQEAEAEETARIIVEALNQHAARAAATSVQAASNGGPGLALLGRLRD